jgi:60 kDa SS-A/Ro ribonucleoprotein
MTAYAKHIARTSVPQTEPVSPGQGKNAGGGFSFAVDCWKRLERFLVLGAEGGTYYAGERKLTLDNVAAVKECLEEDGIQTIYRIIDVSHSGRAPKNEPALLALAIAAKQGDEATRQMAFASLSSVARTGTHLFHFAEYIKQLGGWGRGTTRAFANWYTRMPVDKLALQAIKYQQRDGWSHRDLLRKSHPVTENETRRAIFHWMTKGWESVGELPHPDTALAPIWAFERAKRITNVIELVRLITKYNLPHECVPNEMKSFGVVWEALLPNMGTTAMIRNLGKMTSVGILGPLSANAKFVREQLESEERLKLGRIHPMSMLTAQKIYAQGHGEKGSLTWAPNQKIVDALDSGFYKAFKAVEPTDKRYMLAVDVSGSMTWPQNHIAGMHLSAREAAAAMALVTANVETETEIVAFSAGITPLGITPRMRLMDAMEAIGSLPASYTDTALPMLYALKNRIPVDVFCIYTDNETNGRSMHPHVALKEYRQKMGIPAKLVVFGMTATGWSVADPNDAGMLDVVGLDAAAPNVVAGFARD